MDVIVDEMVVFDDVDFLLSENDVAEPRDFLFYFK